jgi:hypothetical protein
MPVSFSMVTLPEDPSYKHAIVEPSTTGSSKVTVHPTIEETFDEDIFAQNADAAELDECAFSSAAPTGGMKAAVVMAKAPAQTARSESAPRFRQHVVTLRKTPTVGADAPQQSVTQISLFKHLS